MSKASYHMQQLTHKALDMNGATVSNTALGISSWSFSAADLAAATRALITARTAGVMYSYDGTTPTATLGHHIAANATVEVIGNAAINALKMIRDDATDAAVTITLETQ